MFPATVDFNLARPPATINANECVYVYYQHAITGMDLNNLSKINNLIYQ